MAIVECTGIQDWWNVLHRFSACIQQLNEFIWCQWNGCVEIAFTLSCNLFSSVPAYPMNMLYAQPFSLEKTCDCIQCTASVFSLICWLVCFCLWSCHSSMLTDLLGLVYIAADDCLD
jgi:hypothetical protein